MSLYQCMNTVLYFAYNFLFMIYKVYIYKLPQP